MALYYMTTPRRSLARRRMWEQMMDAQVDDQQCKVVFPVDVRMDDDEYIFQAFLPGVDAEDLDIQIVENTVTIQGEIKVERNENDHYLMTERPSGKFCRVIDLPDPVDADKADAELKNGVLNLRVPKSELARPRKIKISNN